MVYSGRTGRHYTGQSLRRGAVRHTTEACGTNGGGHKIVTRPEQILYQ